MALNDDLAVLHKTPLFSDMPDEALRLLAFGATHRNFYEGQALYRHGDVASGAYVVLSGRFELSAPSKSSKDEEVLYTVERGALLGELALISQTRRQFTATAIENCHVMRFDRALFHRLLDEYPELADVVRNRIEQNISNLSAELQKIRHKFA